jgi:thiamine pyridinylase
MDPSKLDCDPLPARLPIAVVGAVAHRRGNRFRFAVLHTLSLILGVATFACTAPKQGASPAHPETATQSSGTPFKAVLFPYIPDSAGDSYVSLIQYLQDGFNAQNPGANLQVIINPNLDVYDYSPNGVLSTLLGDGPDASQVVEVDTILMGTLVANKWVQPINMPNTDVLPAAWQAATFAGVTYGAPTYLCSNVVYSFSNTITQATNATNLMAVLTAINPKVTPLVGNYSGSWTLPSFYVDAWADTNGTAGMATSYDLPLDQRTMSFFPSVVNSCVANGQNPCLDGAYKDTQAETLFAKGAANAFIGYTERLFYIRSANRNAPLPSIATDPIGGSSHPTMFVDSLVFNPHCTGTCLSTAQAFAAYMSSVPVRNTIAFSLDAPAGTLPRYLLQASQSFYSAQPAASDPMYKAYLPILQVAQPFPNTNFPQSRKALQAALNASLSPARTSTSSVLSKAVTANRHAGLPGATGTTSPR